MPFITAEKLQQLLEPSAVITEDQKTHVSYSNKGPGEMDKWASLLEGKDNCWQQRNTSAKKSHAKKKNYFK